MVLGHDTNEVQRTQDIQISEDVTFDTMLLRRATLKGLKCAGFFKPSPIQLHGIPLGKCGFDLLLEAKSGTGKTAVFTVIALEKLDLKKGIQTVILAPTREIAAQIADVITTIGSHYKGLNVAVVMGGLPIKDDIEKLKENVHILVGSPGRLRHLIDKDMDISGVRLFVLDEADKLMESSFLKDINYIFSTLPQQKQVIMSSATFSDETRLFINKYVQRAQHICPDSNSVLLGIQQKVTIVPHHNHIVKQIKHRYEELKKILNGRQFKQCLIFCNYQVRVGELHRMLTRDKWPAEQLYGKQQQTDRLDALKTLQEYKCRILVSTDLAARGIDASNVDLVINFEPASEWQTYLHRIGRAGRYGSYGLAISILCDGKEKNKFKDMLGKTQIPFDIGYLWNDELKFNLISSNSEESLEIDATLSISTPLKQHANDVKREDSLWKILTAESIEYKNNDNSKEVSSFEGLCESFMLFNKPSIESFSELMNSFKRNEKTVKKPHKYQYKHVQFDTFIIDNIDFDIISKKSEINTSSNSNEIVLVNQTNESFENNEVNTNTDLDIAKDNDKNNSNDINNLSEIEINNHKQSCTNEKLPVTKMKVIKPEINANSTEFVVEPVDYQISNCKYKNSVHNIVVQNNNQLYKEQSSESESDTINKALIEAGLPSAFGKQKPKVFNRNKKPKRFVDRPNIETKTIPLQKQFSPVNEITSDSDINKHNNLTSLRNTRTKKNESKSLLKEKDNMLYCSSESMKQVNYKAKNIRKKASNYNNVRELKSNSNYLNDKEQKRSQQFELWYNELKRNTQFIQYTLYIEELNRL